VSAKVKVMDPTRALAKGNLHDAIVTVYGDSNLVDLSITRMKLG
jgi:hypothetical protein